MYQSKLQVLKNYLTNAHTEMLEDGEAGTDLPSKEQLKKLKKEANEMSFGIIKIAEEKKKKKDKTTSIATGVGSALGAGAGMAAIKGKAEYDGIHDARSDVWDKGMKSIADADGRPNEQLVKRIQLTNKLQSDTAMKAEKAYKNTRNKYMARAMGAGALAGAGLGYLTGKGAEKVKEK